jgi:sec-independent protein translocase protein TatA
MIRRPAASREARLAGGSQMFGSLGIWEILLILVIVVVIFGANRIPELGRGMGEGIKNFKKGVKGEEEEKKS